MASWNHLLQLLLPFYFLLPHEVHCDIHNVARSVHTARQQHDLLQLFPKNFSLPIISIPTGNYVSSEPYSEPCKAHVEAYLTNLMSLREVWAMTMFDASTKIPEGVLSYSLISLGRFDECINIRDITFENGTFHGKHCLTSLTLAKFEQLPLKIAVCLPSSCGTSDFAAFVKNMAALNSLKVSNVGVLEHECHTKDSPELEPEDWAAVGILIFFGVLVVLSTGYDIFSKAEQRSKILLAFSICSNGKKLLATSSSGETLHAIHGIRFLSIAWVVMGHRYTDALYGPTQNSVQFMQELISDWKNVGITNATLSVDTFFVLSGVLVSYVFFKRIPKTNSFNVPMFYIHRYLRLTPALAVMILLASTLLRYSGSGPLWETLSRDQSNFCRDNWWAALLYVQNYVDPMRECVGQSWYLAVDMQLHWLSPLVLIPLWKWPKIGAVLMGLLALGGIIGTYFVAYNNEMMASILVQTTEQSNVMMKEYYFPSYTRFVPYLIGIGAGYLLTQAKRRNQVHQMSTMLVLGLWLISASLMLLALCAVQIFQDPSYEYEPIGSSMYMALNRPVWGLGVAIMIYLCCLDHGGYVNRLLSWEWFQPLSRLSYSIYLTHISLQLSQYGSARAVEYVSGFTLFPQFLGDMVLSIAFAAGLSLVFEAPFIILENELLGEKKTEKTAGNSRGAKAVA